MSDSLDPRRKRLLFRCCHMGMVENDLLFGRFAKARLHHLSEEQVGRFEKLIEQGDNDLFNWVSGKEAVPPVHDHDVMKMIKNFKNKD